MQNTVRWRSDQFWYTCQRSWRNNYLDWWDLEGRYLVHKPSFDIWIVIFAKTTTKARLSVIWWENSTLHYVDNIYTSVSPTRPPLLTWQKRRLSNLDPFRLPKLNIFFLRINIVCIGLLLTQQNYRTAMLIRRWKSFLLVKFYLDFLKLWNKNSQKLQNRQQQQIKTNKNTKKRMKVYISSHLFFKYT